MCTKYNHMICLLRYGVWRTEVFVILGHFIALLPHKQLKILEKWKKCLEILSIYTCVPWMKIIWCMVPEIWSMTDRIFCHFCHHKWQSRCMAPVIWRATDIIFCHFGPFFCPFTPLIGWKIKILKKIKKPWRYHVTHVYHISLFLRYGARQTEFFWSFWAIFCLTALITQKIKILKKWKQMEISFYTSVAKIVIICYTVPETWRLTDVNFIFHFGLFFTLLHP